MEIVKSIKYCNKVFKDGDELLKHIATSYSSKLKSAAQKGNAEKIIEVIQSAYNDVRHYAELEID